LAAAAIAYVPLLAAETMTGSAAGPSMPASPVLHIAAGFVGGAAGYIVASHIAANASIRGRMLPRWVTPALWFVLLMGMTIASNEVDGWNSVVVTPAFALAIAVTAFPRTRLGILSSRSMVHLGITSYSLYMTHAIVLFVMSGYSGSSGLLEIFGLSNSGPISTFYALLQLLLCGIVGYGTWRLIEEPSRRAMRRVAVRVDRVLPVEER
jgi:peptidoglycan/LPS O-acetylase OafA/YrhL